MNTISYLKEIYGYGTPIFLKDIRIGGKSKTSIRKDLSRAVADGEINRDNRGVYYFDEKKDIPNSVSFLDVLKIKFIKNDYGFPGLDLDVYGYYSGYTFLNQIGISRQVPAIREIVTNKTSAKRLFKYDSYFALLRKGKIEINRFNYKALQFLDAINLLTEDEINANKDLLKEYIVNNIPRKEFEENKGFYSNKLINKLIKTGLIYAFR